MLLLLLLLRVLAPVLFIFKSLSLDFILFYFKHSFVVVVVVFDDSFGLFAGWLVCLEHCENFGVRLTFCEIHCVRSSSPFRPITRGNCSLFNRQPVLTHRHLHPLSLVRSP